MRHIRRMLNKMGLYRRKHKSSVRDIVSAVSVSHLVLPLTFDVTQPLHMRQRFTNVFVGKAWDGVGNFK